MIAHPVQTVKRVPTNGRHTSDTPSTIRGTVPAFDRKYSHAQADAIASAWNDRAIRPARRVAELARAGELTTPDGDTLPGFEVAEGTIRSLARHARRRRRGQITSPLSEASPRDAIEMIRRRLVNMIDGEMAFEERKRAGNRDPERMRQLARATLEAARIPGPTAPRPASPATKDADGRRSGGVSGGLAGPMMRELRSNGAAGGVTAQDVPTTTTQHGDSAAERTTPPFERTDTTTDSGPGSLVLERIHELQQQG
jgi:hypothetical protein